MEGKGEKRGRDWGGGAHTFMGFQVSLVVFVVVFFLSFILVVFVVVDFATPVLCCMQSFSRLPSFGSH